MIRGVLELEDIPVKEIMIPMVDMISAEYGISLEDLVTTMIKEGHSRIPIYKETIDRGMSKMKYVLETFYCDFWGHINSCNVHYIYKTFL